MISNEVIMSGSLAKLTVSRVYNLYQRNRLNNLLISELNHPVIWITSHQTVQNKVDKSI